MGASSSKPSPRYSTGRSNAVVTAALTIKATAGELFGWYAANLGAATNYLHIYPKVGATSGDTPTFSIPIPTGAATNILWVSGLEMAAGISIRGTTDFAATVGATTGELVVNIVYV